MRVAGDQDVKDYAGPVVEATGEYQVIAKLMYRKVDQFLINFLFGQEAGITAPVVDIDARTVTVEVVEVAAATIQLPNRHQSPRRSLHQLTCSG